MHPNALAAEKDIEPPAGHPALACDSPLEPPSIKPPPTRYYQQFPPNEAAVTPMSTTSETSEFDFRSTDPAHVKAEPTIIDKVKEVLHLHKRH
ncbi:hypothetical protein SVAN01_08047 [Stagonosporopsis vannaccii]|nr:hypothetical protein SVAN01_08047 [Stagonosporopsis vannaccii]